MFRTTLAAVALGALSVSAAGAATLFDQNVTPDVIFGSGNANGAFTVDRAEGVELGMRGKLRYNLGGVPENTFNSNGDGSYSFDPSEGDPPAGRSIFNFEWSINSDWDGSSGRKLDDLTYLLEIDFDPTVGTNTIVSFDPINVPLADHAIGDNTTGNGAGVEATDASDYAGLIAGNNVAQNSWNLGFFEPAGFDPQTEGLYTISLTAYDDGGQVVRNTIDVQVGSVPAPIPLPAGGILLLTALGGLGGAGALRRRHKAG